MAYRIPLYVGSLGFSLVCYFLWFSCLLVVGLFLLAVGLFFLAVGLFLLAVGLFLLAVGFVLLVIGVCLWARAREHLLGPGPRPGPNIRKSNPNFVLGV